MTHSFFAMRAALFLLAITIAAILSWVKCCHWNLNGGEISAPHLVLSTDTVDVGNVPGDNLAWARIDVQNSGQQRLIIHQQTGQCGACDDTVAAYLIVPPDTRTHLSISIQDGLRAGRFSRTVLFHTNDPRQPMFTVKITGNVLSSAISTM